MDPLLGLSARSECKQMDRSPLLLHVRNTGFVLGGKYTEDPILMDRILAPHFPFVVLVSVPNQKQETILATELFKIEHRNVG